MPGEVLKKALLELGVSGLYGTPSDFRKWLEFSRGWKLSDEEVAAGLEELRSLHRFRKDGDFVDDYMCSEIEAFPDHYEFDCPRDLADSPIQFFRSRLLHFLRQKGVPASVEIDIVIAAVEAIENAVKYSSLGVIGVTLDMAGNAFRIQVINQVPPPTPDHDIEIGKYDSSRTLMRGMMVMSRLFDEMDIGIDEQSRRATFRAMKKVRA